MSMDRFVDFDVLPDRQTVHRLLENMLGGVGQVEWNGGLSRFFVTLPGRPTHPASGIVEVVKRYDDEERWVELYLGDHCCVITRYADAFTKAVADGIVKALEDWLGGKRQT